MRPGRTQNIRWILVSAQGHQFDAMGLAKRPERFDSLSEEILVFVSRTPPANRNRVGPRSVMDPILTGRRRMRLKGVIDQDTAHITSSRDLNQMTATTGSKSIKVADNEDPTARVYGFRQSSERLVEGHR